MSESKTYSNFAITFHMQTPIMLGHPWLAFDGILAHLINRELRGQDYWTLPSKTVVSQHFLYEGSVMPLDQTKKVFHASVAQFDVNQVGIATIYKRFEEREIHRLNVKKRFINVGSGLYRAYMMRMPYLPAKTATFYCRGDLQEILRIVSHLPALGKKVGYGYGQVKSVSVEETPENYSLVKDGVAMRSLPCNLGVESTETMMLAYRSPYWDKSNVTVCVPPGAKLKYKQYKCNVCGLPLMRKPKNEESLCCGCFIKKNGYGHGKEN